MGGQFACRQGSVLTHETSILSVEIAKNTSDKIDKRAARKAALATKRAEQRRDRECHHEEVARAKEQERRRRAIRKVEIAFERAIRAHEKRISMIEVERAALDRRSEAEETLWKRQKEKIETNLSRVRGYGTRGLARSGILPHQEL